MDKSQESFAVHGVINVLIHIPVLIVTSFWGLLIISLFKLNSVSGLLWNVATMFPLVIPPVSCIVGIIRGASNLKTVKNARLCMILSIIGMILYFGMIVFCAWIGSIL